MEKHLTGPTGKDTLSVGHGKHGGQLRSSIRYIVKEDGDTVMISFGTNVPYAKIHEYGGKTPPHTITRKRPGRIISSFLHPGSKIPSRPFMRHGIAEMFPGFKETIAKFLREGGNSNK